MSDIVEYLTPAIGKTLKAVKTVERKGIEVLLLEFEDKSVNTEIHLNSKNGAFISSTTTLVKKQVDKKLKAKEEALSPEKSTNKNLININKNKPKARTTDL